MSIPMRLVRRVLALATSGTVFLLAACGDNSPTGADALEGPALNAVLDSAWQDERRAEALYLRVLADHGNALPFFNIVIAEQRHSTAIEGAMVRRGLSLPTSPWTLDNVPRFATVAAACAAGVTAERENIALYDRWLARALPADVQQVFGSNRRASLERHLPAFERCR
jgi:hypothetical protein